MNTHIAEGNRLMRLGNSSEATDQFILALSDPDPLVQRIARHRLLEMHPEPVYASTHSYQSLYHRPSCSAKNVIWARHVVWFPSSTDAESAGFVRCHICKPPVVQSSAGIGRTALGAA
jgi:hypothetical protein